MARGLLLSSSSALALALGFAAGGAQATVAPSLGLLLQQATVVVVATVSEVGPEVERDRTVVLRPRRFLRGELQPLPERLVFRSRRRSDAAVDFAALREAGSEQLFFLRHRPDALADVRGFHLELVDAVFGVQPATPALLERLEQILSDVERAYALPPARP